MLTLGTKVTTSEKFCSRFKSLSFCHAVHCVFAASKEQKSETSGGTVILLFLLSIVLFVKHKL